MTSFREVLGPANFLLDPVKSLIGLVVAALLVIPFASQPVGIFMSAISTYILLRAISIEEKWLSVTPLPPLTVFCLGAWLRCGLGGFLIGMGRPKVDEALWMNLPKAQLLWLALSVITVAIFWVLKPAAPKNRRSLNQSKKQVVTNIALAFCIFGALSMVIGALSGTMDRNPESYNYWLTRRWQPDTFFTMFSRIKDIGFFLIPLAVTSTKAIWKKVLLISLPLCYIIMAIPLGGRGLILYPITYIALGFWLTNISAKKMRMLIALVAIFSLVTAPTILAYRKMAAFKASDRGSIVSRIDMLGKAYSSTINFNQISNIASNTGRSLYACSDGHLFQDPAASRERAGTHRMNTFLTAWIPDLLLKRDIPIRDSHIIAQEVEGYGRNRSESIRYKSFPCISLGGDLYWRGGWGWVLSGSIAAGTIYRAMCVAWYRNAGWNKLWRILLLTYPVTFLTMYPFGSIGESAWIWMWDLPKYIAVIFIAYQAKKLFCRLATNG